MNYIFHVWCYRYFQDGYVENERILPQKYDIISCLAVGGRWITSQPDLQVNFNHCSNRLKLEFH